jgi:hypothetical protein
VGHLIGTILEVIGVCALVITVPVAIILLVFGKATPKDFE